MEKALTWLLENHRKVPVTFLLLIAATSGLALFAPASMLAALQADSFVAQLPRTGLQGAFHLSWFLALALSLFRRHDGGDTPERRLRRRLRTLGPEEKAFLRPLVESGAKIHVVDATGGAAAALLRAGVLKLNQSWTYLEKAEVIFDELAYADLCAHPELVGAAAKACGLKVIR